MKNNNNFLFLKSKLTLVNLSKIFIIFFLGFISRISINYFYGLNVFSDFLHPFSITYYFVFASFIVFINELFSNFNLICLPKFSSISSFKLSNLKLSYIRLFFRDLFSSMYSYQTLGGNNLPNYKECNKESSLLYMNGSSDNNSTNNTTNNNANSSNNTSSNSGFNNSFLVNDPIYRFLSDDDINRLRENRSQARSRRVSEGIRRGSAGRARGLLARLRREENIASNLR
jgi:hypothetical protein